MAMRVGPQDIQLWARPVTRGPNGVLVDNIISARFYIGKYGWGGGEIRARLNSGWLNAAAALATNPLTLADITKWSTWSFDLYCRDFDESTHRSAIWSGPIMTRVIRHNGDPSSAEVVFTLEDFTARALRQRSLYNAASYVVQADNTYADNIAANWMKYCYGKAGVGIITPPNYPTTRLNSTPWDFQAGNGASAGPIVYAEFQPGQPLIRAMETLCEYGGLYVNRIELPTASSSMALTAPYPYQRNDLSGSLILSPRLGTANAFLNEQSIRDLVTVTRVRGDGANAGQAYYWNYSSSGQAIWGNVEGEVTMPGRTQAGCVSEVTKLLGRLAMGSESVSMRVNETPTTRFVTDWGWRDLVTYYDDVTGMTAPLLVTGWEMTYDEDQGWNVDATLGDPRPSLEAQIARAVGKLGPTLAGDWTKQVDG